MIRMKIMSVMKRMLLEVGWEFQVFDFRIRGLTWLGTMQDDMLWVDKYGPLSEVREIVY